MYDEIDENGLTVILSLIQVRDDIRVAARSEVTTC